MSALEDDFLDNWKSQFNIYSEKHLNKDNDNNKMRLIFNFMQGISPIIILYMSISLMISGVMTLGKVIAIYSLSNTFLR